MANAFNWFLDNFIWLQIASILISIVLIIFIVRLMIKINYYSGKREYGWEIWKLEGLRRKKLIQLWGRVLKMTSRPDPTGWKKAVLEVNDFFDDILKGLGYLGSSGEERLAKVEEDKISNTNELAEIHTEIKALKADENSAIDHEKAKKYLKTYRKAFRELGLL